jgi:hypothetical protein
VTDRRDRASVSLYWSFDTSALRDTLDQPFGRHFNQPPPRRFIGNPKR